MNRIGSGVWYHDPWTGETVMLGSHSHSSNSSGNSSEQRINNESSSCGSGAFTPDCLGIALVALRDIVQGEELYLDYKYNVKDKKNLPAWYTPVVYK